MQSIDKSTREWPTPDSWEKLTPPGLTGRAGGTRGRCESEEGAGRRLCCLYMSPRGCPLAPLSAVSDVQIPRVPQNKPPKPAARTHGAAAASRGPGSALSLRAVTLPELRCLGTTPAHTRHLTGPAGRTGSRGAGSERRCSRRIYRLFNSTSSPREFEVKATRGKTNSFNGTF